VTLVVATLLLFAAGPFVLWPLIKTPPDEIVTSPLAGEVGLSSPPRGEVARSARGDRPGGGVS
jgi:hypothetical protein